MSVASDRFKSSNGRPSFDLFLDERPHVFYKHSKLYTMDLFVTAHDRPYFEELMASWHGSKNDAASYAGQDCIAMRSPCIFGCKDGVHVKTGRITVYNTEQLTRKDMLATLLSECRAHDVRQVFDYSEYHKQLWTQHGFFCMVRPATSLLDIAALRRKLSVATPEASVAFVGTLSERRYKILAELVRLNFRVVILQDLFGPERDNEIAKCKVLLNIHYADDYKIFEAPRCTRWALAGLPVVSEQSVDQCTMPNVTFVRYDSLVDAMTNLFQ